MQRVQTGWLLFRLHNVTGIALFVSLIPVLVLLAYFHVSTIVILSTGIGIVAGILYSTLWIGYFH